MISEMNMRGSVSLLLRFKAIDPNSGAVLKTQQVEFDPSFLSESAGGQYLYAAYNSATDLTQNNSSAGHSRSSPPVRHPASVGQQVIGVTVALLAVGLPAQPIPTTPPI
jgi:hypothetical protein